MAKRSYLVIGATGLVGSGICEYLARDGAQVRLLHSRNYAQHVGARVDVVINCNGNTYRFRANQDPVWDFEHSVASVERSLQDFACDIYCYMSTVDVYHVLDDPSCNHEDASIDPSKLDVYGFHKWVAERLVERFASRSVILRLGTVVGKQLRKGPFFDLVRGEPLHMSLDSELTVVGTDSIAMALEAILATNPVHQIYNVTGAGSVRLRELPTDALPPICLATDSGVAHRYDVNTQKLSALVSVPTSWQAAIGFLHARQGLAWQIPGAQRASSSGPVARLQESVKP